MQQPTSFERAEQQADADAIRTRLAGARITPYWLDSVERPEPAPPLDEDAHADLCVVGGGYTGLWTALRAKEREPERDVVLLEGRRVAWAASGRNGGFVEPSLTHGRSNGELHAPEEVDELDRLGRENLDGLVQTVRRYGIECDLQEAGLLNVATEPHQLEWLEEGEDGQVLHGQQARALFDSPLNLGVQRSPRGAVLVQPAELAFGLRRACLELGVRIHEHSPVEGLRREGERMLVRLRNGSLVSARRVALATNAFPSPLRRYRMFTVPVYDYALVTAPLSPRQLESIGWPGGEGVADLGNRFHYLRLVRDGEARRILFGGYDAIAPYGRRIRPEYDARRASFERLAVHFAAYFPSLSEVRFTHAWGGAIDSCSRFFAFHATAHDGLVAYSAGFTGLGVAATRFAGDVMLDQLDGLETERTRLRTVQRLPKPFPPEPFASIGIRATMAALAGADRNEGRRGPLLRVLDALKMGFDS
ncbi:MAG: FAD-dependent oxidoreductase [Pseudoclavibacter sp.]|nr:FAD-dependent oxidoreductase [Pseudoclavibacter sp.]